MAATTLNGFTLGKYDSHFIDGKLRHRMSKWLTCGHTQSLCWNSGPGCLAGQGKKMFLVHQPQWPSGRERRPANQSKTYWYLAVGRYGVSSLLHPPRATPLLAHPWKQTWVNRVRNGTMTSRWEGSMLSSGQSSSPRVYWAKFCLHVH